MKIGGGLLRDGGPDALRRACNEAAEHARSRPVLIVPGGGPFADAVRDVDLAAPLGDRLAHRLALTAMDQLGAVLHELLPAAELIRTLQAPASLGLLLAVPAFTARPDVPESWAVTSDSLAVLAAGVIGADRTILLKPVDGVFENWPPGTPAERPLPQLSARRLRALQRAGQGGAVDAYLPDAIERTGVTVTVRAPGPDAPAGTRITPD